MSSKQKVAYFYDPDMGQFYYGQGHPMKPHRVRMAHSLILHYGLYSRMQCYRPHPASASDMRVFHADDYVQFLRSVSPGNAAGLQRELREYNMQEDCPVFDGLWRYCQLYAGGSIGAAVKLNHQSADIAINWAGGLHHGKKAEASGFCYINDIVLAILELLKYHARVLYVDIDVHHGDGVEEAFLTTDRVMTVSFHKFGSGFFPGTGDIGNVGHGAGQYYAVNAPLHDGITDAAYASLFKPVMARIVEAYRPEAIVLQCGSDSLAGDRLGVFNLSSRGHAACVAYMKTFGLPLMLLGGGGYTIVNVARCWAAETGVALGVEMDEILPLSEYREYYAPEYELQVRPAPDMVDHNTQEYLNGLRSTILEHVSHLPPAPSVPFYERPPDAMSEDDLQHAGGSGGRADDGASADERDERDERGGGSGARPLLQLWNSGDGEAMEGLGGRGARVDISYRDGDSGNAPLPRPSMMPRAGGSGGGGDGQRSPRPTMLRPAADVKAAGGEAHGT